jgi:hypothetical protein
LRHNHPSFIPFRVVRTAAAHTSRGKVRRYVVP